MAKAKALQRGLKIDTVLDCNLAHSGLRVNLQDLDARGVRQLKSSIFLLKVKHPRKMSVEGAGDNVVKVFFRYQAVVVYPLAVISLPDMGDA